MTTDGLPEKRRGPRGAGRATWLVCCWVVLGLALGCGSARAGFYDKGKSGPRPGSGSLEQVSLKQVFAGIAGELCGDGGDCGRGSEVPFPPVAYRAGERAVLVADFVDLQSLQPGRYGVLMGELMRGSLSAGCGYRIMQVEFAKYLKLTESGLVVLTRNAGEIQSDRFRQSECVVGTYSMLGNKLLVFVRKIDTTTGRITRMAVREIELEANNLAGYSVQ